MHIEIDDCQTRVLGDQPLEASSDIYLIDSAADRGVGVWPFVFLARPCPLSTGLGVMVIRSVECEGKTRLGGWIYM